MRRGCGGASVNDKFMMFGVINIMTVRHQQTLARQLHPDGGEEAGLGDGDWEDEAEAGRRRVEAAPARAAELRVWIIYQPSPVSIKGSAVTECDTDINGEFYLQKMCHESKLGSRPARAMREQCGIVSVSAGRLRGSPDTL